MTPGGGPAAPAFPAGRGCGRWAKTGCLGAVVVLAAVMVVSFFLLHTGVEWAVERARDRLEARLPDTLSAREREQFLAHLDGYLERAKRSHDPARWNGGFLERVGAALEDGQVTREEVVALDRFLSRPVPPGSPTP